MEFPGNGFMSLCIFLTKIIREMLDSISFARCFDADGDEGEHGAATSTPAVYLPCTYSTLQNRLHVKKCVYSAFVSIVIQFLFTLQTIISV